MQTSGRWRWATSIPCSWMLMGTPGRVETTSRWAFPETAILDFTVQSVVQAVNTLGSLRNPSLRGFSKGFLSLRTQVAMELDPLVASQLHHLKDQFS